jgi:hypothetical protein
MQGIGIKDSQGNKIIEQRQVLKIWENYIQNYKTDLTEQKT